MRSGLDQATNANVDKVGLLQWAAKVSERWLPLLMFGFTVRLASVRVGSVRGWKGASMGGPDLPAVCELLHVWLHSAPMPCAFVCFQFPARYLPERLHVCSLLLFAALITKNAHFLCGPLTLFFLSLLVFCLFPASSPQVLSFISTIGRTDFNAAVALFGILFHKTFDATQRSWVRCAIFATLHV